MLAKQLAEIVHNDQLDKIVPFLKSLGDSKKEILPTLKKLFREYSQYEEVKNDDGSISYHSKAVGDRLLILSMTAFVCCDEKGFSSMYGGPILSRPVMEKLLPWHCPTWFSAHINKYARENFFLFDYENYLYWVDNKYVQPSTELIAKLLPSVIFDVDGKSFRYVYVPENLHKHPVTLAEHIWLIFQHETSIHTSDRYMSFSDGSKEGRWINTFIDLTERGLLDRKRLLHDTLLATNRNFNQALSGWFSQLFMELKPQYEELAELVAELLNSFNSNSTKQVNAALKYAKVLIETNHTPDNLSDYLNITITSNTKSIVLATLACIEEFAKRKLDDDNALCHLACSALVHSDAAIQIRTAKFLRKYGAESNQNLRDAISAFSDNLLIESRSLLSGFVRAPEPTSAEEPDADSHVNLPREITPVDTFEDLLFLASQAFDNNESWHFEHLCNSLLLMQDNIHGEHINKFSPALQRAVLTLKNDPRTGTGFLDKLLATFFIEYSGELIKRYPANSADLQKVFQNYAGGRAWEQTAGILSQWDSKSAIYQPFKKLLVDVLNFLKHAVKVPLLCCPDYYPCRVSASSLVHRLKIYQSANVDPSLMDFQIAVSRLQIADPEELKRLAEAELKGTYKDIFIYLVGEASAVPKIEKLKSVWLVASIWKHRKKNADILSDLSALRPEYLTGNFEWKVRAKQRYIPVYSMEQKKYVDGDTMTTDRELRIIFPEKHKAETAVKRIFSVMTNRTTAPSIYDDLILVGWISSEAFDIKRSLYLVPDNPDPVLAQVIFKALVFSKFYEEPQRRLISETLEALLTLEPQNTEMSNLFVAACMMNGDKTVASYAAELWIRRITSGDLDNNRIGEMLGTLEQVEYAPLKRLTDLMFSCMFKVSAKHNQALEALIVSCISQMPDEPITNTKKLLDLYSELLVINNTKPSSPTLLNKLNQWQSNTGLKKTIARILSL
ncbi:DUF6493 family protein [Pedobacter deserti]|uniref:DUF6493 family protein n=1 Tax=Pedobacter deserti TaxID=2817382 RepID=UPI00210AED62|nr:DUF6493 family protein [Pedobacter sp. SYSU D00382]